MPFEGVRRSCQGQRRVSYRAGTVHFTLDRTCASLSFAARGASLDATSLLLLGNSVLSGQIMATTVILATTRGLSQ